MGFAKKFLVLLLGLGAIGLGLWPLGALAIVYLLLPLRGRRRPTASERTKSLGFPRRFILSAGLAVVGVSALASGGIFSPLLFLLLASVFAAWPVLPFRSVLDAYVPLGDSTLLRARWFPLAWAAVAEVKPGSDFSPGSLSSYEGRLVAARSNRALYVVATALAFGRRGAEDAVIDSLRRSAGTITGGAFLLPLDGAEAARVFSSRLRSKKIAKEDLLARGPSASDLLVLESAGGFVSKAANWEVAGPRAKVASVPSPRGRIEGRLLLWEVLDAILKSGARPEPDAYSSFLESARATVGEPLSERFISLEGEGGKVSVQGLGGEKLDLSRSQLRAIVSVYGRAGP